MQPERVGRKANSVTCKKNVVELPDRMSALGQKQTYAAQETMSALTPDSDRESEIPQKVMSALPPKADMCSALADVRFGPKADSRDAAKIDCY